MQRTIETLAALSRPAGSDGEREAAHWLAQRLRDGCARVRVEDEPAHLAPWVPLAALCAVGAVAGRAGARTRRRSVRALAALAGGLASAAVADDIGNGPRVVRGLLGRRRVTTNVIAEAGDPHAERTLVVLAHHDAARSGLVFHPWPQHLVARRFPQLIESANTSVPMWWPVVGAPGVAALGALTGRRRLARAGALVSGVAAAALLDIAARPPVPGANDNLSGVAGLVGVADDLAERPVQGLRVLLVSCGGEESLQEGIRAFAERHFPALPRERTWFLNLETVGSPQLSLLEGEGVLRMEDFPAEFQALVAQCAAEADVPLRRGLRSRNSTDSVLPLRAGYPVATLVSVDEAKALSNYHWPTDTPQNLDYATLADAVRLTLAVAHRLAEPPFVAPAPQPSRTGGTVDLVPDAPRAA